MFWRGDDQFEFEACPCLTSRDKIFLTSALRKTLILPVNWLGTALRGALFAILSTESFICSHRRIAVFLKQTQPRLSISQQGQEKRNCSGRLTMKESN